ncbi:MAG: type VI secretion system-associated FHA domain protein TagH [Agarilytica sp.]
MAINLSIIKSPVGVTLAASQKRFGEEGGTIGRGDGNDWVLSDPDRFLSSRHCSLSCEGGQYYLTDLSTNGTFINGAPEPVGKGGKIPLNENDTIELGDYQFRVETLVGLGVSPPGFESSAAAPSAPTSPPVTPPPLESSHDPFGATAGASADPFASIGNNDPFAEPLVPNEAPSQTPPPVVDDPFAAAPHEQGLSLSSGRDVVDPLAALDSAGGFGSSDSASDPFGQPASTPMADPFAKPQIPDDPLFGGSDSTPGNDFSSMGDDGNAMSQSVDWPEAKNENLIPEGWDDDLMGGGDAPSSAEPVFTPPPAKMPKPSAAHQSMPLTSPPNSPDPLLAARKPDRVDDFEGKKRQALAAKRAAAAKKANQEARAASSQKISAAIHHGILENLGFENKEISQQELDELVESMSDLMPVIISGMMQVLRARASIKNEFRMNVTTIQPVENNPLKFSANTQEAMDNMFLRKSDAYMRPKQAFQEGFDGIGEHQVAIIAGIREAFKSMMDRFDPDKLEHQFDRQSKGVAIPGMQKNKYWNNYVEYYKGFIDNMENSFQYLFGDEFVQAYEEQLRRLAFERKQKQKQS